MPLGHCRCNGALVRHRLGRRSSLRRVSRARRAAEYVCGTAAAVGRRDLPHAGPGRGGQRPAAGILRPPDLAGKPLQSVDHQPDGGTGHRPIHAGDRRDARADQRLRAVAGAARVGELPARAAYHVRRQSRPGRRRLQCRPGRRRGLACRPRRPAVRDAGLCPPGHRLYGRGLDGASDTADGVAVSASGYADRGALRRAGQRRGRSCRPAPRLHRRPGLGTMGRAARRQLLGRGRARPLRAGAPSLRGRAGRLPAAGRARPSDRRLDLRRPHLGEEPRRRRCPMRPPAPALCSAARAARPQRRYVGLSLLLRADRRRLRRPRRRLPAYICSRADMLPRRQRTAGGDTPREASPPPICKRAETSYIGPIPLRLDPSVLFVTLATNFGLYCKRSLGEYWRASGTKSFLVSVDQPLNA